MSPRGVAAPALLAASLLAASLFAAGAADRARSPESRAAEGAPPLGAVTVVAVDLLWLRGMSLLRENRWPECLAALEAAGRAAPRLSASFEARALIVAYNLAGGATTEADRDRWVAEGIRILEEGVRRNPGDRDLTCTLGGLLFERSARWPTLRARLRADRGRDPLEEGVDLLEEAFRAEPDRGKFALTLSNARVRRGRLRLERAPAGAAAPDAAGDFLRASEVLRDFAGRTGGEASSSAAPFIAESDALARAAATADAAERERILRDLDGEAPGK